MASIAGQIKTVQKTRLAAKGGWLDKYFYFAMSLLIPVIVVYGFSFTIDRNLIHPLSPRPRILYVHAGLFCFWLLFFVLQAGLVRVGNVKLHRSLGWFGVFLGAAILTIGLRTTVVMARFHLHVTHDGEPVAALLIPIWDMIAFGGTFSLAVYWRRRPEFHRRLMLMATCMLTAAAFGRFPVWMMPPLIFYSGVDFLIALGALRDWIVNRQIHRVYAVGLPLVAAGQTVVMSVVVKQLSVWVRVAERILK